MFCMHPYLQTLKLMRFSIDADQRGSATFRCSKNRKRCRDCIEGLNKCEPGVSSHSSPSRVG